MVSRLDSCGGKKVSFVTPHTVTVSIYCGSPTPIVRDLQPRSLTIAFQLRSLVLAGPWCIKSIAPRNLE